MLNIFKSFHEQEIYNFDYSNKKVLMNRTIVFLDWDNRNKLMSPFLWNLCGERGNKKRKFRSSSSFVNFKPQPHKMVKNTRRKSHELFECV